MQPVSQGTDAVAAFASDGEHTEREFFLYYLIGSEAGASPLWRVDRRTYSLSSTYTSFYHGGI